MEEVRSYWQVAGISHFCNVFGKPLKLPTFEPEELEQAFILDIPSAPLQQQHQSQPQQQNHNSYASDNDNDDNTTNHESDDRQLDGDDGDPDYMAPASLDRDYQSQATQHQQQQPEEQHDQHLLVKLAIALLKHHFNCKISHANWENYLRRIIDTNWVELEQHPSPFRVPLVSQDGVELTKNLAFNDLPLSDKIDIFYALCDYRLWCEDAADALRDYPVEELRLESIGKDSQGYEYWYFFGTRLYRENKELSQDIILRKKRMKELEYKLIELDKTRIAREQEEKRKAEAEKAKQLAAEAREARLAVKKQQEREARTKRKQETPIRPLRSGLRERRSSAVGNNHDSQPEQESVRTTRSKVAKQQQPQQVNQQSQSVSKNAKVLCKNSKPNGQDHESDQSPSLPRKSPEEECKDELEKLKITPEDRAEAWCLQCESLEDWEKFASKFEKTKSINEKYLSAHVNEFLLPTIRAIYAKRAAEVRKKERELVFSLTSRRVSSRIISKRAQEEEEERKAQQREAEMRRKKIEAETRLRGELEREMRVRQGRFVINGTSSNCSEDGDDFNCRYNLRQHQDLTDSDKFDGIIHPDKLSDFYEAIELIVDSVRTSKHAWPFVDPVPDTVPGYYDLIDEPMDLRKLRTKVEFREYRSLIELEKDFQLIVNNCEKFNGPRNVYTKMVYKLWKSFRKNVKLYLQRDLSMNEYETFVHPPPPREQPAKPPSRSPTPEVKAPTPEPASSPAMNSEAPTPEPHSPSNEPKAPTPEPNSPVGGDSEALASELVRSHGSDPKAPIPEPIMANLEPSYKLAKYENYENHCEDIIIDSYDVVCPDENFFLWSQDASCK